MLFSIPTPMSPVYTMPQAGTVAAAPTVGNAVKDLENSADTQMGKIHAIALQKVQAQFKEDQAQYEIDFQSAVDKAEDAKRLIGSANRKKMEAITVLVANILAVAGVVIASALTGVWPLVFIAVPFLVGMVPSSYYVSIFCQTAAKLERDIQAPNRLNKPVLHLPTYNSEKDLELRQSRLNAQNAFAEMPTLQQVATYKWSSDEIVNYALLDRVTKIDDAKRPAFYGKCIQLIKGYGVIVKEREKFLNYALSEYNSMDQRLRSWKRERMEVIESRKENIEIRDRRLPRGARRDLRRGRVPVRPLVKGVFLSIEKNRLYNQESDVHRDYAKLSLMAKNWHAHALNAINTAFNQALGHIEYQYTVAKSSAV